ncbi:hypothetical protein BV898_11391 [Hypsibius exemplaris]|uniref:Cystatin domain-containing protein n=1 Tax=Hypsibius exemplaris TaxID=2072580 RepID=A0A1W0WGT9_HYPEX|nr:hypothetical protein BV898_11391 [Hypsibius exemplaris]
MNREAAQVIANQIRDKVEGRTGVLPQFLVENYRVQRLNGTYTLLKINVGSGRYVHVEVFQAGQRTMP